MPRRTSDPISRRERPSKPALSHAGIVRTAVEIMQAEGLQRVTMRRLAKELDTGPASLYVYVADTAELHAAILETLLGEVDLEPASEQGGADPDTRLAQVLASYTEVLFANPSLARSAMVARPSGPNYLALVEAVLRLLREGGTPDMQAAWGVDVLLQVATATAAEHSTRAADPAAEGEDAALIGVLRSAPAEQYPRIAAIGEELFTGTHHQRLEWTFRALIHGVRSTPRGPATAHGLGSATEATTR
jgi:AcrR family transcriptional regulator